MKSSWETKAKERYRQYIYNMRSTTKNPTRKKPSHISSEVWTFWNAKWNSEEFRKKSEQNKKNRRKGVADGLALSTHTGGSASHLKIASNLVSLFLLIYLIVRFLFITYLWYLCRRNNLDVIHHAVNCSCIHTLRIMMERLL